MSMCGEINEGARGERCTRMYSFATSAEAEMLVTAWLGIARSGGAKQHAAAALPPLLAGMSTLPAMKPHIVPAASRTSAERVI